MRQYPGFTNYPDNVIRPVQVLSYDNNKYATVRFADGREVSIKRGYIFRDADATRRIPSIDWHVLGGGTRKTYKSRFRKTTYHVYNVPNKPRVSFDTQANAVSFAIRVAAESGQQLEVQCNVETRNSSFYGYRLIVCFPSGQAVSYDYRKRARRGVPKYLRGYGKVLRQR